MFCQGFVGYELATRYFCQLYNCGIPSEQNANFPVCFVLRAGAEIQGCGRNLRPLRGGGGRESHGRTILHALTTFIANLGGG